MTLLNRWLSGSSAYENYQRFVREIVEPLYKKLGIEIVASEHKLDRYNRAIAINLACQAGLDSCLAETAKKLQEIVSSGTDVAPDMQSAIYCNGLRQSNSTTFFHLQNKMFKSEDQGERTLIIAALGCSQDATLLAQFLNLALLPGDALRLQEKFRVLSAPVNNGELGLRVLMNFIRESYQQITAIASSQVDTMLSNIASRVASQTLYDEFDSLLKFLEASNGITESSGVNLRASAKINLDWQKQNLEKIDRWLSDGSTDGDTTTLGAGSAVISTFVFACCALLKFLM